MSKLASFGAFSVPVSPSDGRCSARVSRPRRPLTAHLPGHDGELRSACVARSGDLATTPWASAGSSATPSALWHSPSAIWHSPSVICPLSCAICHLAFVIFQAGGGSFPQLAKRLDRPQQLPRLGRLVPLVPLELPAQVHRGGRSSPDMEPTPDPAARPAAS